MEKNISTTSLNSGFLRTRPTPDVGRTRSSSTSGGNLAVKDIDMALRWVKLNIASFGGDPNRIILVGHDTGAALVNFLLVAPSSKGKYSIYFFIIQKGDFNYSKNSSIISIEFVKSLYIILFRNFLLR